MQRERITERLFVFRSDEYAQVTASLALTSAGAVLIDTLLYPEETRRIRRFAEEGLGAQVSHLILTHFHADHATGAGFFPEARIVAHQRCRELLDTRGRESLRQLQASSPEFDGLEIALPQITFESALRLEIGDAAFLLQASPGHSPDSITCLVEADETLVAGDSVMPLPFFVDGSLDDSRRSLARLLEGDFENIVQGHGDIILRGEAPEKIKSDLLYLDRLETAVKSALHRGETNIEASVALADCGKSHVLLSGLAPQLHQQNIRALLRALGESPSGSAADNNEASEGSDAWRQTTFI